MSRLLDDRRYAKTHEWLKLEGAEVVVGITDHAQSELTDIVFVELPAVGKALKAQAAAMLLESVKTVSDIYAPADGTVSAVNTELKSHPELINQDPYGRGWLFRMTPSAPVDPSRFLDANGYRKEIGEPAA